MTSTYISLQILPDKGRLGIHFFISKHDCYFERVGYIMGGWAALDLSSILFKVPEIHCGCFAPLYSSDVHFIKSQLIKCFVLRTLPISDWSPVSRPLFKAPNYQTSLVPVSEKVAPLKALIYDRIFAR